MWFAVATGGPLGVIAVRLGENVQRANGLVSATNNVVAVSGWALAAALLSFVSVGSFVAAATA
jgi:hypothetical protein